MKMNRPKKQIKLEVWARDRFICHYCGKNLKYDYKNFSHDGTVGITIDHVIPLSQGGTNTKTNLVTCCIDCNQKKARKEDPHLVRIYR